MTSHKITFSISLSLQVAGVTTNIGFLTSLASHPAFQEGDVHTGFIEVRDTWHCKGKTSWCTLSLLPSLSLSLPLLPFITQQHTNELFPPPQPLSELQMLEAALALLALEQRTASISQSFDNGKHKYLDIISCCYINFFILFLISASDPFSPFSESGGTRVNTKSKRTIKLQHNEQSMWDLVQSNNI